jgi:hypothetical protein
VGDVMGVRCWADRFAYVILEGTAEHPTLVASDHVLLPVNHERAAQLSEFRKDLYDIVSQYAVKSACFRSQEPIAKKKSLPRSELEGVLQEMCYSHTPRVMVVGRTVKQLKSILKYQGQANRIFELSEDPHFSDLAKTNFSEAIVAALAGLAT